MHPRVAFESGSVLTTTSHRAKKARRASRDWEEKYAVGTEPEGSPVEGSVKDEEGKGSGRPERVRARTVAPQAEKRRAVSRAEGWRRRVSQSFTFTSEDGDRTDVAVADEANGERLELADKVAAELLVRDPSLLGLLCQVQVVDLVREHEDLWRPWRGQGSASRRVEGCGAQWSAHGAEDVLPDGRPGGEARSATASRPDREGYSGATHVWIPVALAQTMRDSGPCALKKAVSWRWLTPAAQHCHSLRLGVCRGCCSSCGMANAKMASAEA